MFGPRTRKDAVIVETIEIALMTATKIPPLGEKPAFGSETSSLGFRVTAATCITYVI